jgi:hypothetical protein
MNHDATLTGQIAQLSADQAQEAVQLFYELMPNSWWADQGKMSQDDIDFQAKMIQQHAPDDVKPLLKALSSSGNRELKGEIARGLLRAFAGQEPLVPYLEQAIEMAHEPDMFIVETGTLLIILALIPTAIHVEKNEDGWKVDINFENLKSLSGISGMVDKVKQTLDTIVPPDWGSNT